MEEHKGFQKVVSKEKLKVDNDIFAGEDNRRGRPYQVIPEGTEILELSEMMEIDVSSKGNNTKVKRAFQMMALIWNMAVLLMVGISVAVGSLLIVLFFIIFIVAGMLLGAKAMQTSFNRKKIIVSSEGIEIEEFPFVIKKNRKKFFTEEIKQLFVVEKGSGISVNGKTVNGYALRAQMKDNKLVDIIDNANLETVMYLEQEIERFLEIEDGPMPKEIL